MTRYFDGIRVGDRVYLLNDDEPYVVTSVSYDYFEAKSQTGGDSGHTIRKNGETLSIAEDLGHVFFWRPVKNNIDTPPRPKRMVKKVVEGWVNIYPGCVFRTKDEAIDDRICLSKPFGPPLYIRHEYEVEE